MVEGPDEKHSEFKLILEGFKLTEKQERTISAALQRVVAGHLADLDFEGDLRAGILELPGGNGTHGGKWLRLEPGQLERLRETLQPGG